MDRIVSEYLDSRRIISFRDVVMIDEIYPNGRLAAYQYVIVLHNNVKDFQRREVDNLPFPPSRLCLLDQAHRESIIFVVRRLPTTLDTFGRPQKTVRTLAPSEVSTLPHRPINHNTRQFICASHQFSLVEDCLRGNSSSHESDARARGNNGRANCRDSCHADVLSVSKQPVLVVESTFGKSQPNIQSVPNYWKTLSGRSWRGACSCCGEVL